MIKSKLYLNETVLNSKPRKNAIDQYIVAYGVDGDGNTFPLLFTETDIDKAKRRAENNMEDVPLMWVDAGVVQATKTKMLKLWISLFG